jgi:hypothetical protein
VKLLGDIILGSPKERQVLVSKSIKFLFLILKKKSRRMICKSNNKHYNINKSLSKMRLHKEVHIPNKKHTKEFN